MSLKDIKKQIDEAIANVPKVYQAGYDAGSNIDTDAIYQDGYNDGHSTGYSEGHDVGFTDGKKSEYDAFWDAFQQNGARTRYVCSFGSGWNTENFRPKYPIRPTTAYMMFFNNIGEYIKVDDFDVWCEENNIVIDFSNCTNGIYAIATLHANKFNTLNFSKCTSLANLFYSHNEERFGAVEINNFVVSETTVFNDTTFQQATRLTKLIMNGTIASNGLNVSYCKNLTHESLMSIITALKDFSSVGGSHKVTLGGDNIAKLTNDELNMIEVKGWNYA